MAGAEASAGVAAGGVDQAGRGRAGAPLPAEGRRGQGLGRRRRPRQAQDWEGFITTGLAAKLLGDGLFYKKPIDPQLAGLYEPLLRHARGVIVGTLVSHTEATYKLLAAYADAYQRLKLARRDGASTISPACWPRAWPTG